MRKLKFNGWAILSTIIALMVVLPNLDIIIHLFQKPNATWFHIKEYLLKDYVITSAIIVIFTIIFAVIIGVTLAWLISAYDFPLRKFLRWALILPLAIPPYIGAYTYAGMVSYTGVVQRFFRNVLNMQVDQKYFDIMSIEGTIFIFIIFLFPYVYMITRTFLEKQSSGLIESARLLGSNSLGVFFRVIMPICRGVIVSGGTLVALEVLSDYGVVSYFGVQTFSTAIFKSWISLGDVDSAIRLAGILMVAVFALLSGEKVLRGRKKFSFTNTKVRPIKRKRLKGIYGVLASAYALTIFALGFLIPVIQMISWGIMSYKNIYYGDFLTMIMNSVLLAGGCSLLIVVMALIIANYCRMNSNILSKIYSKVTLIGYSIPGAVIAITMILFFVDIDKKIKGLALSTSIIMLVFAYIVRFLAIGFQNVEGGFEKVGNKFTEASRTLGYGVTKTFFKIDIHMLKPAILGAFALTFVDIIKELPLVLNLRPFNFYTLSTKVFEYANDEMIPESAIPSLVIVLVSFVAIFILYKVADKEES
ncbi:MULTISPECIES: ABC transporter permease [Clostridium]|uniref:Iron ABC transporter permease n=1 Tax=Clostridium cadaveris TaxID=1529 RepID=A0A1I2JU76_9CLOT|nr:iron ABC transporter permease [Clostridium cadaveris]MDU4952340.1 iron ABC transporter permease [Clostridium sp.]NME64376.1 iron ABC transporter permease [Clostridium cadaveris]NWK12000.1 iron ABC transporter permease [Clostridium cadaveris]PWL53182.1 MAG: iron ABC transporter permease [Clostridium cadaveris]UFH63933.1 iron ABC transporter permease [Clostridium cadaveris]